MTNNNMKHWSPPNLCVNLSAFAEDLEKRIAEDEENNTCCVCYELSTKTKLECRHTLCRCCFEKLECCPMCRVSFMNEKLITHYKLPPTFVKELSAPLPTPQFAYANSFMTVRKSITRVNKYEAVFKDRNLLVDIIEWAPRSEDLLARFTKNGNILTLLDDPIMLRNFCAHNKEPLLSVPYSSVDHLFND